MYRRLGVLRVKAKFQTAKECCRSASFRRTARAAFHVRACVREGGRSNGYNSNYKGICYLVTYHVATQKTY